MNRTLIPALLLALIPAARADAPPPVKEGLWSVTIQSTGDGAASGPARTSTLCRSHAYDDYMHSREKQSGCTVEESLSGTTFTEHATCPAAGVLIDSTSVTTKISDTAYHTEAHTTMTPPLHGVARTTRTIDHKYLGSCPADQQPGDMTNADGGVIHTWRH